MYWQNRARAKQRIRQSLDRKNIPDHWEDWLFDLFPNSFDPAIGFADHHAEYWEWIETLKVDNFIDPLIFILARGGGKTTSGEYGTVRVGAKETRKFVLIVRRTQDKSNEMVSNVARILENSSIDQRYPGLGGRLIGKYGNQRGWNVSQLRCANGFSVVGLGMDTAIRGIKLDDYRPDLIIFDDIDDKDDNQFTIDKKIKSITKNILPAGAANVVVMFLQNLIHSNSIASSLVDRTHTGANYLITRKVIGPIPAIKDFKYKTITREDGSFRRIITGGTATWKGQPLEVCQKQIDDWGWSAFDEEAQHDVSTDSEGALWSRELIKVTRVTDFPRPLKKITVNIDPHSTTGQTGIIVVGVAEHPITKLLHGYVLEDCTPPAGCKPEVWATAAVAAYNKWQANAIIGEINHGGDMIEAVIRAVDGGKLVVYKIVRASRGKEVRAEPVSVIFAEGRGHIVGYAPELENQLCGWEPGDSDSPDRLDAMVWGFTVLMPFKAKKKLRIVR